jgi:hypothetical protein
VSATSWPTRFAVTVYPFAGPPQRFTVATWVDRDKATDLAVGTFQARWPEEEIVVVRVEELGAVSRDASGVALPDRADLIDRAEW